MKKTITINYDRRGMEQRMVEVVDARESGEYEVVVNAIHTKPNTRGRVIVRVVAGSGAKVKIVGVIKIASGAEMTDNFLELRALTLSEKANVTLDPRLEIEANNVQASHAASIGPIDLEQVKYLESKGLSESQAKEEIIRGWLEV